MLERLEYVCNICNFFLAGVGGIEGPDFWVISSPIW